MNFKARTLAALRAAWRQTREKSALAGLDGFVDAIVTPIHTIPEFAQRIAGAAGKSTNIEFNPLMDKLGGSGPSMANALLAAGTRVTYIGAGDHFNAGFAQGQMLGLPPGSLPRPRGLQQRPLRPNREEPGLGRFGNIPRKLELRATPVANSCFRLACLF